MLLANCLLFMKGQVLPWALWLLAWPELAVAYSSYAANIPNGYNVQYNGQSWPGVGHTSYELHGTDVGWDCAGGIVTLQDAALGSSRDANPKGKKEGTRNLFLAIL